MYLSWGVREESLKRFFQMVQYVINPTLNFSQDSDYYIRLESPIDPRWFLLEESNMMPFSSSVSCGGGWF